MHNVTKKLNMNIALPAERFQHGVNIYILPFYGVMGQSTVNIAMCLSCQLYTIYKELNLHFLICTTALVVMITITPVDILIESITLKL